MPHFFIPIRNIINVFIGLDIDQIALDITKTNKMQRLIISLNTEGQPTSQLFELGEDGTGKQLSAIGGDYSPFTIEKAKEEGRPKRSASHVNLKDTGAFYLSFRVIPFNGGFTIEADTIKDGENLEDDWGKDIVGLKDENLQIIIEFYKNEILEQINSKLQAA